MYENCKVVPVEISNIQCGNVFSSISKLRKHNEKKHSSEALTCTKCEKFFISEDEIKKHECHIVVQNDILMITKGLQKILENDEEEKNRDKNQDNQDSDGVVLKPKIKMKQTRKKSSKVKGRNTKNVDFYRDNLIIINSDDKDQNETASELLACESIEEDTEEEFESENNSSSEIFETEDSESENGEVCSDTENLS